MKKNIMMRLASFLLVAVLISTSAISGTYAKYVTADEGKDHARVAKFGVVVEADSDIFDVEYLGKEDGWTGKMTVQATENVVAPGTTKTMANVKLSGTPEVAVRVSNEKVNFEIGDFWMVDDDCNDVNDANYKAEKFYCPLIINVVDAAGTEHNLCGLSAVVIHGHRAFVGRQTLGIRQIFPVVAHGQHDLICGQPLVHQIQYQKVCHLPHHQLSHFRIIGAM